MIIVLNSLFDKKTAKRFDTIAAKKAKLGKKEEAAVNDFMTKNSKETIVEILDIVDKNGHPKERYSSHELRKKYSQGKLAFDDIILLDTLYKSNYKFFKDKDKQ